MSTVFTTILEDPIFEALVFVCIGSVDDSIKELRIKHGIAIKESDLDECDGIVLPLELNGRTAFLLWLSELVNSPASVGTLTHEAVHVSQFVMNHFDIHHSRDSWEVFAYYSGSVVSRILYRYNNFIKSCTKKKGLKSSSKKATVSKVSSVKKPTKMR